MPFHSPYIDYSSVKTLNKSLELPYPTGEEFQYKDKFRIDTPQEYESILPYIGATSLISTHRIDKEGNTIAEIFININLPIDTLIHLLNNADNIKIPNDEETYAYVASKLNLSIEQTKQVYDLLKQIIDKHNLYLNNLSNSTKSRILDNYKMYQMSMISKDPQNLVQAQSPIDAMTKPLKLKSEEILTETPGNFMIKYKDINRCQVGAKGIGICATSLKTFFGLTQHYNEVLSGDNAAQQERLLFSKEIPTEEGIKKYQLLANVFPTGEITNETVLEAIQSVKNETDAALVLSALLSLSTDNAKELQLYLLNASTKTLGLYTYGISIGMDFKDITKILTSPIGLEFSKLLNGNVFLNDGGTFSVINTFKYFEQSAKEALSTFSAPIYDEDQKIFINLYNELFRDLKEHSKGRDPLSFLSQDQNLDLKEGETAISKRITLIEETRQRLNHISNNPTIRYRANQLIDAAIQYIKQQEMKDQYNTEYEALRQLAYGADEMRTLGSFYSLNQGLPTTPSELLQKVLQFQDIINDRIEVIRAEAKRLGRPLNIDPINVDIIKFVYDEKYRNRLIKKYNEFKDTYNVLDSLTVEHYFGYLEQLANAHMSAMKTSWRYRSAYTLYNLYKNAIFNKNKLFSGILDYLNDYTINTFLEDIDASFVIPEKFEYFNGSSFVPTDSSKPIFLGNTDGNVTFKRWMDTEVIPKLKEGITSADGKTFSSQVKGNRFIQGLEPHLFTRTTTAVPSISYSLSINMLPRSDAERSVFNIMKQSFNRLHNISYVMADGTSIPLIDLLYYYNLISFSNKLGQQTLTSIFADFQNMGTIQKYHNYEAVLDKTAPILKSIDSSDIYPYIASFGSPYSATDKVIFYKDIKRSFVPILLERKSKKELIEMEEETPQDALEQLVQSIINNYVPINLGIQSKYHLKGTIKYRKSEPFVVVDGVRYFMTINNQYIENVKSRNATYTFPKNTRVPFIKDSNDIDTDRLQNLIRNLINQC